MTFENIEYVYIYTLNYGILNNKSVTRCSLTVGNLYTDSLELSHS